MAQIVIDNLGLKSIEVRDVNKTLLQHFHDHRIDWMQACGGKGRCTTCMIRVLSGAENAGPVTLAEEKYRLKGALKKNERLACQAKIMGNIIIAVPDECKLPHLQYSY